jgi:hypothetical protein
MKSEFMMLLNMQICLCFSYFTYVRIMPEVILITFCSQFNHVPALITKRQNVKSKYSSTKHHTSYPSFLISSKGEGILKSTRFNVIITP